MRVKHIKFKVNKPGEVLTFKGSEPWRKPDTLQELNWSLGLGPCGRHVALLEVSITLAVVTIRQTSHIGDLNGLWREWSSDVNSKSKLDDYQTALATEEIKSFSYKLEDVRGRIEAIEVL